MMESETPKLRICLLVTQGGWGGAQRYVHDVALAMREHFDVTVAFGKEGNNELHRRLRESGVAVRPLRHLGRAIRPIADLIALFELVRLFNREKFDLIHTNSSKADILGTLAARLARPRPAVCATIHGWVFLEPLGRIRRLLYIFLERLAGRLRNQTIVLSERERIAGITFGIAPPERFTVIPLGLPQVTLYDRAAARRELISRAHIPEQSFIIGTIANLYKTKGIDLLAQAVALLADVETIIIGEGPERFSAATPRFHFLGAIKDAHQLLAGFDIFVLPSRKEGFPYVLLEALQAGLPIVATDVGGVPAIIEHEKNGLLVPAGNVPLLARALSRLAIDQGLRSRLAAEARASAGQFPLDAMIRRTREAYERTIRGVTA